MKIYTKTGDDGTTGLFTGARVSKYSLRIETYGTLDELNSLIGVAVASSMPHAIKSDLEILSRNIFKLCSDLATPFEPKPKYEPERLNEDKIFELEKLIDDYTSKLTPLKQFILPGGTIAAAHLHHCRTVCRRAERLAVKLSSEEQVNRNILVYINRLSDYFFTAARYANHLLGLDDVVV